MVQSGVSGNWLYSSWCVTIPYVYFNQALAESSLSDNYKKIYTHGHTRTQVMYTEPELLTNKASEKTTPYHFTLTGMSIINNSNLQGLSTLSTNWKFLLFTGVPTTKQVPNT